MIVFEHIVGWGVISVVGYNCYVCGVVGFTIGFVGTSLFVRCTSSTLFTTTTTLFTTFRGECSTAWVDRSIEN